MDTATPRSRPLIFVLVAAVVAAVVVLDAALAAADAGRIEPAGAALLAAAVALAFQPVAPRTVLVLCLAAEVFYSLQSKLSMLGGLPLLVAVCNSVRLGHRWFTVALVGPVVVGMTVYNLTTGPEQPLRALPDSTGLPLGWIVAAAILGEVFRQYRNYIDQAEQRALAAEHGRHEAALRMAGEERLRIARELHDSLTHAISVIKMQSSVAVHLAHKQGQHPSDAVLAIQQASVEANRDLRSTLKVLREGSTPEPGLHRLSELVEQIRLAGVTATVAVEGRQRRVPTEVDWTAYRIIQESLTNVARHSGSPTAQVLLRYRDDGLEVSVSDQGRGDPGAPPVPGIGLTGMNERVAQLGGRLTAAPREGGGFDVQAWLPLGGR